VCKFSGPAFNFSSRLGRRGEDAQVIKMVTMQREPEGIPHLHVFYRQT